MFSIKLNNETIRFPISKDQTAVVNSSNSFIAMIGSNGVYKSEILASLAIHFGKLRKKGFAEIIDDTLIDPGARFSKVISCSISPFCKFPITKSTLSKLKSKKMQDGEFPEEHYVYLGIKSSSAFTSNTKSKLYDLVLRVCAAAVDNKRQKIIANTLKYLSLEQRFVFHCSIKHDLDNLQSLLRKRITKSDLERLNSFIKNKKSRSQLGFSDYSKGTFLLEIDFSSRGNINSEIIELLINLETLRKANLLDIDSIEIQNSSDISNTKEAYVELTALSSGKSAMLMTFLGLAASACDDSLILIDEPEIGLHPGAQIKYMGFLDEILKSFRAVTIIFATHSPHLLSSLPNGRSTVCTLSNSVEQGLKFKIVDQNIEGWASEDILLDIFDVKSTRSINVANDAVSVAEMIAGIEEYDSNIFGATLDRLKRLQLNSSDHLNDLVNEAEKFRLVKERGT